MLYPILRTNKCVPWPFIFPDLLTLSFQIYNVFCILNLIDLPLVMIKILLLIINPKLLKAIMIFKNLVKFLIQGLQGFRNLCSMVIQGLKFFLSCSALPCIIVLSAWQMVHFQNQVSAFREGKKRPT